MRAEIAGAGDEPELRRLLRENAMAGEISVSLQREPNYHLGAEVAGDRHHAIVLRDEATRRIVCMGSCSVATAFVNGRETRLGYLSQLRLDREFSGHGAPILRGHERFRRLHEEVRPAEIYISSIVADNRPARRLLERGVKGLPRYEPLEPFSTLVIALPRLRRSRPPPQGVELRRGRPEDIGAVVGCLRRNLVRYQFARAWTAGDLASRERTRDLAPEDFLVAERGAEIVGCLAVWDQRAFKQSVVRGYGRRLGLLRPWVNLVAPLLRVAPLPVPGESLRAAFLSHLAVDGDDPAVFRALLDAGCRAARARDLDYLLIGLAGRNPLLPAAKRDFPFREYPSLIYRVHWGDGPPADPPLDGRCPHLEVALL